ncbi:hypothetical protein G7Y79_00038g074640 [Physcia stellaris]|nr:hypothetical protein G7Y79_00038g074640 [Physcia stellaris]
MALYTSNPDIFSRESSSDTALPDHFNLPASRVPRRKKQAKPAEVRPAKKRKMNEYESLAHNAAANDTLNDTVRSSRKCALSFHNSIDKHKAARVATKLEALQTVLESTSVPSINMKVADTLALIRKTGSRLPPPARYVDACVGTNTIQDGPTLEKQGRLERLQAKNIDQQAKQIKGMQTTMERKDFAFEQLRRDLAEEREFRQTKELDLGERDDRIARKNSEIGALKDRIDDLKGTIDDLKKMIASTQAQKDDEVEKYRSRVERYKSDIHGKDKQLTKLEEETLAQVKTAASKDEHLKRLKQDLQQERGRIKQLTNQHGKELAVAKAESDRRLIQSKKASHDIETLELKVNTLKNTIEKKNGALASSATALEKAQNECRRLIEEEKKRSEKSQQRVDDLTKDVHAKDSSLAKSRDMCNTSQKKMAEQTQRINVLEVREKDLLQRVANLSKDCQEKETVAMKNQDIIHTLEDRQRKYAQRVEDLEKTESNFRQRVAAFKEKIRSKDTLLRRSNDDLTKTKAQHRKSTQVLKKGNADQKQNQIIASKKLKQLRIDKRKLDGIISGHEITIQEQFEQARQKDASFQELKRRIESLAEQFGGHESNLHSQNQAIEHQSRRITDLLKVSKGQRVTMGTLVGALKQQVESQATILRHRDLTIEEQADSITDLSTQLNNQEATMATVIVVIAKLYMRVKKYKLNTQEKDLIIQNLTTQAKRNSQEQIATQWRLKTAHQGIRSLRSSLQEMIAGFGAASSGRTVQCSMNGVPVRVWVFFTKDSAVFLIQDKTFSLWRSELAHARFDFDEATSNGLVVLETTDGPLTLTPIPLGEDDDAPGWLEEQLDRESQSPEGALPRLIELDADNLVEEIGEG